MQKPGGHWTGTPARAGLEAAGSLPMDRNTGRLGARTVFKIELLPLIRHTVFFRDEGPVFGTPRKKPAEGEMLDAGGP